MYLTRLFVLVSGLFLYSSSGFGQSLTDSLKAKYPLDGHVFDVSGNGFHLSNNGATSCPDRTGTPNKAYYFDGVNDFMSNTSASQLRTDQYSVAFWMKIDGMPASGNYSIAIDNGGTTKDNGLQIAQNYNGYTGIGVFTYKKSSSSNSFFLTNGYDTSAWHYYVVSRSYDSLILYIDGVRIQGTNVGDSTGYSGTNMGFYLGNRHGNQKYFNGKLDEVQAWSRPLSQSEAIQLYTAGGGQFKTAPSPVCIDYRFSNNTLDSGGQAYNLTANGGSFTNDRFGNANSAILLDGVNDYLVLNNADSFRTGAFTMSAWVKPVNLPGNGTQGNIACLGDQTFDHGLNFANNYLNKWNGFTGYSYNATSGNATAYDSTGSVTININDWYHVAVSRDDSLLQFFINGQLIESEVHNQNMAFSASGNKLWIGGRYGTGSFFNGAIDDLHICNSRLDDSVIMDLYVPIQNNPTPPVVPGPVCIDYKFSNNTLDSGGQAYNLTANGGSFTNDRFGNANSAILLDGVNDYLVLNNADSFRTGAFTMSAWVKPVNLPGNGTQGNIACLGDQTFDHGLNFANNYLNKWNGFTGYSYNATSGNATAYDSTGSVTININDWYHVAVSRDDSLLQFFINGQLIESEVHNQNMAFSASGNKLWIGGRYGTGSFFNGAIDDLHICNSRLDDSVIMDLYVPYNPTSVNRMAHEKNLSIYPNPSQKGEFKVRGDADIQKVTVYNALGQAISINKYDDTKYSISSGSGIYFITLELVDGSTLTYKWIVNPN